MTPALLAYHRSYHMICVCLYQCPNTYVRNCGYINLLSRERGLCLLTPAPQQHNLHVLLTRNFSTRIPRVEEEIQAVRRYTCVHLVDVSARLL